MLLCKIRQVLFWAVLMFAVPLIIAEDDSNEYEAPEPQQTSVDTQALEKLKESLNVPWTPHSHIKNSERTMLEQFLSPEIDEWVKSQGQKSDGRPYDGEWKIEQAIDNAQVNDYALVLQDKSKHHGISKKLKTPIRFDDSEMFVVQYEVKIQESLDCGGAYMKLVATPKEGHESFDATQFSESDDFSIMFGPDKCGHKNLVHFIFKRKNKEGKMVEHHHKQELSPPTWDTKTTHLYTLIVYPKKGEYEILIDNKSMATGELGGDAFEPSVNPPKTIPDPEDQKPQDWDEQPQILDPNPENYNEQVPKMIDDPQDVKPEGWLDDEEPMIVDTTAEKPAEWDSDIDGEWTPSKIPNPKCLDGKCGEYTPKKIPNPEYKARKMVANPNYKGIWKAREIANPEYEEAKNVGVLSPISAVGFELWTLSSKILFDNVLVSNELSRDDLIKFTSETWVKKHEIEKKIVEITAPKTEAKDVKQAVSWREQLTVEGLYSFIGLLLTSPRDTLNVYPVLFGVTVGVTSLVLYLLYLLFSSKQEKTKESESEPENDEKTEAKVVRVSEENLKTRRVRKASDQ